MLTSWFLIAWLFAMLVLPNLCIAIVEAVAMRRLEKLVAPPFPRKQVVAPLPIARTVRR